MEGAPLAGTDPLLMFMGPRARGWQRSLAHSPPTLHLPTLGLCSHDGAGGRPVCSQPSNRTPDPQPTKRRSVALGSSCLGHTQ